MNSAEQVFDAALALPEADRVELVEALIASLQPADRPPFDESWREVIRRRSNELRSGQATPVPWEEVKRQVHTILDAADRRIDAGAGIGHDEFWKQVESATPTTEGNGGGKKRRTRRRG